VHFYFENEEWIYPWFHEPEELGVFWRGKALRFYFGYYSTISAALLAAFGFLAATGPTLPRSG